jgi:hypothetical protein
MSSWKERRMLSIRVEFTAGTNIKSAIVQSMATARRLDCFIVFGFNGVDVTVGQDEDIDAKIREFERDLKIKAEFLKNRKDEKNG